MTTVIKRARAKRRHHGFVLLTTTICVIGTVGAIGLVVDLGRAFITKNEVQLYSDSAALAATMEPDGSDAGPRLRWPPI